MYEMKSLVATEQNASDPYAGQKLRSEKTLILHVDSVQE